MAAGTSASTSNAVPAGAANPGAQWFSDFSKEYESTRKLLERYPDGKGEWRPHPKSGTLSGIATHVAEIAGYGVDVMAHTEIDLAKRQRPPRLDSARELTALSVDNCAKLEAALSKASLDDINATCTVRFGEHVIVSAPRRVVLRGFVMNHLIHHRGQLGVYLRLLEVPIPGMYGPSADEPM